MSTTAERRLNLVGGEWRDAPGSIDVLDPADERQVVATVPAMGAAEVDAVYAAATAGAATWRATSTVDRGRVLLRTAGLLRERAPEIARTLTREMGKTLAEASGEVGKAADFFEYYGGLGRAARGELIAHERADVNAYTVHEPLGVVLAITPWNDPLLTPARKLAPALIAGNAVVLKPASYTPLVALELARALDDAGLPAGVVNTVTGSGAAIGDALIEGAPAAVSFTGSNDVGADLRLALAERDVPLLAELGGKNAAVVLGGGSIEQAASSIAAAAWAQAGQRCTATSRVIVERSRLEPLVEALRREAERLVVGPGLDSATTVGPLVSGAQRDSVIGFVERAVAAGATIAAGGGAPEGKAYAHGCYVAPTLLVDVDTEAEIWTEEVFGPVVAVVAADDEAHALDLLNGSRFGLAAALYARDVGVIQRFVAGAEVGQVAVNLPTSGWDVHMPFGGAKVSGSGHKEQGIEGLHFYSRTKTVAIAP
ncbi:MAG: aldehyde dehydrogenase [Actinobacteria bacterium]|nr:aldehyde dehydrogenase [Actinomycetota bacterium]